MKLKHTKIPREFVENIPAGLKYVQWNGKDYLVVEQVFCPSGHSLIVDNVRLHGEPSIKLGMRIGDRAGEIYVDAYWGSHDKLYGFVPPSQEDPGDEVNCSVCGVSLFTHHAPCTRCGTRKFIQLLLPGGKNRILVCAKLGCSEHELLAVDFPAEITGIVNDINYFGL